MFSIFMKRISPLLSIRIRFRAFPDISSSSCTEAAFSEIKLSRSFGRGGNAINRKEFTIRNVATATRQARNVLSKTGLLRITASLMNSTWTSKIVPIKSNPVGG